MAMSSSATFTFVVDGPTTTSPTTTSSIAAGANRADGNTTDRDVAPCATTGATNNDGPNISSSFNGHTSSSCGNSNGNGIHSGNPPSCVASMASRRKYGYRRMCNVA